MLNLDCDTKTIADCYGADILFARRKDNYVPTVVYWKGVIKYNKLRDPMNSFSIGPDFTLETFRNGRFEELYKNF